MLILLVLTVLLAACQPDPRREAEAYATRSQADLEAANAEQARQQSEELHQVEMQKAQIDLETKQATADSWRHGVNLFFRVVFWFAIAAVCYTLFVGAQKTVDAYGKVTAGVGDAIVRAATVRANLIQLDVKTRQYPVFLNYIEKGKYALVNPNTNSTILLDTRNEPDRQMIASVSGVQIAGMIGYEARKSNDAASIALISPPIVEAQEGELLTGVSLMGEIAETSKILARGGRDE